MNFENILDLRKIIKYKRQDELRILKLLANQDRNTCLTCRYAYKISDSHFCRCIFPKKSNLSSSRRTEVTSSCKRYEIKRKYKKYIG